MRVILDTSVIVSGHISGHGSPAQILKGWRDGAFTLLYTPAILQEWSDVLSRSWLTSRLVSTPNRIQEYLDAVVAFGELTLGQANVAGLVRDPFDEMFLACARLSKADYLVSVDKDLLVLGEFETTRIVTPAEFVGVLAAGERR